MSFRYYLGEVYFVVLYSADRGVVGSRGEIGALAPPKILLKNSVPPKFLINIVCFFNIASLKSSFLSHYHIISYFVFDGKLSSLFQFNTFKRYTYI